MQGEGQILKKFIKKETIEQRLEGGERLSRAAL